MKTTVPVKKVRGFTLIELIVVIAILATLASIGYPAIMSMRETASVAASSKMCADLVSGVSTFKQDHNGILPYYVQKAKPDKDDQIYLVTLPGKDAGLLSILTGYEEDNSMMLNHNKEAYIKPTRAEEMRDGLYGESGNELGLYDPWGKPYYVVLCEMTEGCVDPFTGKRRRGDSCLVYGLGPDGDGIAPAHEEKKHKSTSAGKGKKKKMSKAERRKAMREAQEAASDAISDNVYSWKKTSNK